MFFATLNDQEKTAFLALADAVIRADGRLAPQEESMFAAMLTEMALPRDTPVPEMDIASAAAVFSGRPQRVAAMLELMGLSLSDGDVAPEEDILLARIGEAFGFSAEDLLGQRGWVLRQIALVREAAILMMEGA